MKRFLLVALFPVLFFMTRARAGADIIEINIDLNQIQNVALKPNPAQAAQPVNPNAPVPMIDPNQMPAGGRGGPQGGKGGGGKGGGGRGGKGGVSAVDPFRQFLLPDFNFRLQPVFFVPQEAQPPMPDMPPMGGAAAQNPRNWLTVYVDTTTKIKLTPAGQPYFEFYKWGKTWGLATDKDFFDNRMIWQGFNLAAIFERDYRKELQSTKDPQRMIFIASMALSYGLTDKYKGIMEDLKKLDAKNYAVVNYNRVLADLAKPSDKTDPVSREVVDDLVTNHGYKSMKEEKGGHYILVSKTVAAKLSDDPAAKFKLAQLEELMERFYFWFALSEGRQPAMPRYQLMVIVPPSQKDFEELHEQYGYEPMATDAFTPRRDNLLILSRQLTDESYKFLAKNNQALWTNLRFSRDELLTGDVWTKRPAQEIANVTQSISTLQTLAIAQKALEEHGERNAITHEGTRQLLAASGLLPGNVAVPEWVLEGIASFFETAYDAPYGAGGFTPHWDHCIDFRYFRDSKKLDSAQSDKHLQRLFDDSLFREARQDEDRFDQLSAGADKDALGDRKDSDWALARSSAWSFCYFLFKTHKGQNLMRYAEELGTLPRDLIPDQHALEGCFIRAFDLADSRDPAKLDHVKLKNLSNSWFAEMDGVSLEVPQLQAERLKAREGRK